MSSGSAKQIKKQALAAVNEEMNRRLNEIESYVKNNLAEQNQRAKNVQGWIVQEVKGKIQQDLFNANCTIDAVVEVLADAGLHIEGFAEKVDARKVEIAKRREAEAVDEMKAKLQAQQDQIKANLEAQAAAV